MFGVDNGSTGRKVGIERAVVAVAAGAGATETGVWEDYPPTHILHAAYVGALELLKSMVARGVAPDAPDVLRGSTPLHWACFGGHLHVVRWLVKTAGAETDRPNNDGCTPLLFACERGHMGVAQWLVREGGAKVNVSDSVMWQTPLHRVCLNAQRDTHGATVSDVEELFLWLVEAGADLTAVDRFGNHVEDLRTATVQVSPMSSSHAKLCDMIYLARQEGATKESAREKLRRRSSVRRKSTGDLSVQLSPKLEAKQRAPFSRRGSRKGSNGSSGGSRGGSSPSSASPVAPQALIRTTSYGSTPQGGNRQSHQRRSSGGRVVSKTPPNGSEESEFFSASPARTQRANIGSGGGVAAAASGAGARMGGGPPAPTIAGLDLLGEKVQEEGGAGYMDEMVAIFGGGKTPSADYVSEQQMRRKSTEQERQQRWNFSRTQEDTRHKHSMLSAEEVLHSVGIKPISLHEDSVATNEKRRLDGAGQQVVERIRELAMDKSTGKISEDEFLVKKRQLLEMEHLRRDADEETRRRAQGHEDDTGAGILTSVGQNTPPPSPKVFAGIDYLASDDGHERTRTLIPDTQKDQRETYKASDIDRYTSIEADEPRVFGEVPQSVKESLAAKEALREATAGGFGQDLGKMDKSEKDTAESMEARKSDSPCSPPKDKHAGHDHPWGATADGGSAAGINAARTGGGNQTISSRGCACVIM